MILNSERVRSSKCYSVGYSPFLEKYVLAAVVSRAAWYNIYFFITEEEYDLSFTAPEKLDRLADECYKFEEPQRFIFSEKTVENNSKQNKLYEKSRRYDKEHGGNSGFYERF